MNLDVQKNLQREYMRIWSQLERTDPEQTKAFQRAGGFKGTAVRPMYAVQKMTEVFGPVGAGWGTDAPTFQVVGDAVFCTVRMWYGTSCGGFYGVGGDTWLKRARDGTSYHDDEAFKKAYTDALTNAMKLLGMSADVHLGLFDDSKYVAAARQPARAAPSARQTLQDARGNAAASDVPAEAVSPAGEPPRPNMRPPFSPERIEQFKARVSAADNFDELAKLDNWFRKNGDMRLGDQAQAVGRLIQIRADELRGAK